MEIIDHPVVGVAEVAELDVETQVETAGIGPAAAAGSGAAAEVGGEGDRLDLDPLVGDERGREQAVQSARKQGHRPAVQWRQSFGHDWSGHDYRALAISMTP
ncbi:MAG: hypothetical protein COA77_05800 [Thaumarchaeota archaeon]|nr:MAG: hypothetical protein COA77_05800 [Nitrososphaerota archaeon]